MNNGNKFCKNCGCPLKDEDRFCKNCGTAVSNQQEVNNNQQQLHDQESNSFHQTMNNQPMGMNNGIDNRQNNISQNQSNNRSYNMSNNNFNSHQNNSNSNVSFKYAVIGIVLLVLVGVGVYLLLNMGGNTPSNNGGNSNSTSDNSNNNSYGGNTQSNSTKSVYFKGFTFEVPASYVHEIDGDMFSFGNSADTWYAGVQVLTVEYSRLISNKNQVIARIEGNDYKVNTYNQKTYSGMECIIMEVDGFGQKMLVGYVKANSSKVFVVSVANLYKDYDYSLFEDTIKVLKTGV